jgi:hypothetical protein
MNALAPIRRGSEKRSFGNGDMSDPFPIPRGNGARYGRALAEPMPAIRADSSLRMAFITSTDSPGEKGLASLVGEPH